jgi:hypothetical protein
MSHFIRVTGIVITLTLLLAVAVGPVQAHQARPRPREAASVSTDEDERAEDTPLVCLALVGGTALLAGGVWIRKLRGTPS